MNDAPRVLIRSKGRRFLQLYYVDQLTGREVTRSAKTDNHQEAEKAAMRWELELAQGGTPRGLSWDQFVIRANQQFLNGRPKNTETCYQTSIKTFESIIGKPRQITMINADVMAKFAAGLKPPKYRASTAAKHVRHVRSLLRWAWRMGWIASPPAVTMPRVSADDSAKGRPITVAEFNAMIKAIPRVVPMASVAPWRRFLWGLWLSGFRIEELMRLSWDSPPVQIRLDGQYPCIEWAAAGHKANRKETSPITPDFAAYVAHIKPRGTPSGLVFPLPNRSKFSVSEKITAMGKAAGILVSATKFGSAHDLRRSFASRWALRVQPVYLRALMRHRSIATTMAFYVRHDSNDLSAAIWKASGRSPAQSVPANVPTQHNPKKSPPVKSPRKSTIRPTKKR